MRNCQEYEALISALLDGALEEHERRELEEHLACCPDCQRYLTDLREMRSAWEGLDVPAPAGFAGRVMEQVRATAQDAPERKVIRLPHWRRWAAMAACCALVLLGVWTAFTTNGTRDDPDGTPDIASYGVGEIDPRSSPIGPCSMDDGLVIPLPSDGSNGAMTEPLAGVLVTGSDTARAWVEMQLGQDWADGGQYVLTEAQYAELREALTAAKEDFTETVGPEGAGGYLLIAE